MEGQVLRQGPVRNGHLRKGDSIYDGDKIILNENGFLSFMFFGDKTSVDIHGNTIVKVFDSNSNSELQPNIVLFGGKLIVQMEGNHNQSFRLDAPSSTAIASNAHFMVEYRSDMIFKNLSYSMFTLLGGEIEIQNLVSEIHINLKRGETVMSTLEGKFLQLDTFRNQMFIESTLRNRKR
tara:strand:- start:1169 stop:1705 length:537 start_codon:yes stop_codon:yes gene_type:complete